jgi:hypothetical protein
MLDAEGIIITQQTIKFFIIMMMPQQRERGRKCRATHDNKVVSKPPTTIIFDGDVAC